MYVEKLRLPMLSSSMEIFWPSSSFGYMIERTIGNGATSIVKTAYCPEKNQHVGIKIVDLDQDGMSVEEMQRELRAMHLCKHENLVSYFTSFVNGSKLWIVMELMDAGSVFYLLKNLKQHLGANASQGILPEAVIISILKQVVKGLKYLHREGHIHRDIKSDNILLNFDGSVRLCDLGISAISTNSFDRSHIRSTFIGTPCWMAPEVMDSVTGYNYKADIWSLGITAIEMVVGAPPYSNFPTMKVLISIISNPPPTLESCSQSVNDFTDYSEKFRKFIAKCLQKDPFVRPTTSEILKMKIFRTAEDKSFLSRSLRYYSDILGPRQHEISSPKYLNSLQYQNSHHSWVWPEHHTLTDFILPNQSSDNSPELPQIQKRICLRIRNLAGDINDIVFNYDSLTDPPEVIVQEMIEEKHIRKADSCCVSNALRRIVDDLFPYDSLTFRLDSFSPKEPNEKNLIGYAKFSICS